MSAPVKIPLIVRKNIKEEWDAKLPKLKEQIKDLLGEDYDIVVDFPTIYAGSEDGWQRTSSGEIAYKCIDNFITYLEPLVKKGGNDTVEIFNRLVSTKTITIILEEGFPSYSGSRIKDGAWQIIFKPLGFGTNTHDANYEMNKKIDDELFRTDPTALPLTARISLKEEWEPKKAKLAEKVKEELNDGADITFNTDHKANWEAIAAAYEALPKRNKSDIDLENANRNYGRFVYSYFETVPDYMNWKFKGDEMIVEGFLDEVSTKEIWLEIVAEGPKSYNDNLFRDGKLVLRTTPKYWGTNIHQTCEDLIEKL